MGRSRAVSALILLGLAGCQPPPAPPAGTLEVTFEIDTGSLRPREGELATLLFRIRNATAQNVLLRDLTAAGGPGAVLTWQFSQPGNVEYSRERDEWTHERRRAGKRPAVFNSGLLLAGEAIAVRARFRLLGLPRDFALTYFELSRGELAQKVYFEERLEGEMRYRRRMGADLDRAAVPDLRTDAGGHRTVIFPFAQEVQPTTKIKAVRIDAALEPRAFSLAEAARRAGVSTPEEHTFSAVLDGWVLRSGDGAWLVTPSTVVPLPRLRQMERLFHYVDVVGVGRAEIEFLRETKTLFSDKRRIVTDAQHGRYYLFMPPADLPAFFKEVREFQLVLDVEVLSDGGGRILVTR